MSLKLADRVRERVQSVFADMSEESNLRALSAPEALREFMVDAFATIVRALQAEDGSGAEKKAAAMELAAKFYDSVLAPLEIPYVPDSVADPLLRVMFLKMADYVIDSIVAWLKSVSVDQTVAAFRTSGN
jgi:hypothetical protein